MKLSEGIDYFSGVIAAHNQLAVGPVVEELKLLTIMTEGCIDRLFEVEVPNPRYLFGMTNILSADGVTTAMAVVRAWPDVRRIALVHPDYAFGRWFQMHFEAAREKLLPQAQTVSEVWAPLGSTEFSAHIAKTQAARPDLVVTAMWGGMYVAFYKQALQHGLLPKTKIAGNINFGVVPRDRQGPSRGRAGRRAFELSLHGSVGEPVTAQQAVRGPLSSTLEGISQLHGRGGLHGPLPVQDRRREGERGQRRLAGRRGHHQGAGGPEHRRAGGNGDDPS